MLNNILQTLITNAVPLIIGHARVAMAHRKITSWLVTTLIRGRPEAVSQAVESHPVTMHANPLKQAAHFLA